MSAQKRYSQAVAKASSWLANAQQADGSLGPDVTVVGEIQTVPISLALAGYPESAGRLLRYIQRVFCHVDGSFRQPSDAETLSEWCYSPSWVVIGAQLNGCFEISRPAMIDILGFQDPRTGGFFGHPRNRLAGQGTIVPSVSAVAGCAALTTGHVGAASELGDYFLRLIAIQPDLENCFYPFFDTRHGLMTDGTPEFGPTYYGPFQTQGSRTALLAARFSDRVACLIFIKRPEKINTCGERRCCSSSLMAGPLTSMQTR